VVTSVGHTARGAGADSASGRGSEREEVARALGVLVARHHLPGAVEAKLGALLAYLASAPLAPTRITAPLRAIDAHLADALSALELEVVRGAEAIVDIGAGAGFPGLPLAAALVDAQVTLLDGAERKCAFIAKAAAAADIGNARARWDRAETWRGGLRSHDLATARAVGPQATVLEYAAPLLRVGGVLVDWRGRRDPPAEKAAAAAARQLGLEFVVVRHVEPFAGASDHHLHVFRKEQETPDRFPRRAGIARKRPLPR
jgi:16S rRNA (guanine527-N7)-methyltransferase